MSIHHTCSLVYSDFVGPSFSGMMTVYKGFGNTMTYYSMGCVFMIVFILSIKVHKRYKKFRRSQRAKNKPLYNGAIDENSPLLFASINRSYNGLNNPSLMV